MKAKSSFQKSLTLHLLLGFGTVVALGCFIFGWATSTEISGAVIASGKLAVDSNVKKVQQPTGGVVGDLRVKDGDHVKKGDIVARLDETQARTNLAIVTKALDELAARQARNEAERDTCFQVGQVKATYSRSAIELMADTEQTSGQVRFGPEAAISASSWRPRW